MRQTRQPQIKPWLLAVFFLFMVICTLASRIYDSVTIPKVTTTVPKRKTVETLTEGKGRVKVKEKEFCRIFPGLRIKKTAVMQGSQVKEGDVLFWYDLESVLEKKEELENDLEKIDMAIEKEQISREHYEGLTETEAALWELELARRELEEGQREFQEKKADHEAELERLKDQYERGLELAEEELWQQQEKEWEMAREQLDTMRNSREEALREQEWKIEDLLEEIEALTEEEEKEKSRLEKQLKRAREDLEDMRDSWNDKVDSARFQMDYLDNQERRISSGQTSVQEARREAYEAAIKQEEEGMENAQKDLDNLEKAVEKAQWQAGAAQKQDQARQLSFKQQEKLSELNMRELKLDRTEKEKQLQDMEELAEGGGVVKAFMDGTVADMELAEGRTATGEELLSLAGQSCRFEGAFVKEEQELTLGDVIEIDIPGTPRTKEARITAMNLLGEEEGVFWAELDSQELALGTVTSYTCSRQSQIFDRVIPLEGLRKDTKGYYCLVVRPIATILGEEFWAERVEVQVIYQGYQEAAIEGSVFEGDQIITGENKTMGEGDRVRPIS